MKRRETVTEHESFCLIRFHNGPAMSEYQLPEMKHYQSIRDWRVIMEKTADLSPTVYALEEAIGEAVAKEEVPATLRVWQGPRAIVVSKKDIRTKQAQQAASWMKEVDWPVFVRQSGGTAVPHGPGTLNVSLFLPRPKKLTWNIDTVYKMLGLPLMHMLKDTFSLDSYFGEVPGSFCDGRYNVVVQGKKIVGTSQVWKGGPAGLQSRQPGYILAHATLLTHIDQKQAMSSLNAFYELAEGTRPIYVDTVATLASFVTAAPQELDQAVSKGLTNSIRKLTGEGAMLVTNPSEKERKRAVDFLENCFPESYQSQEKERS